MCIEKTRLNTLKSGVTFDTTTANVSNCAVFHISTSTAECLQCSSNTFYVSASKTCVSTCTTTKQAIVKKTGHFTMNECGTGTTAAVSGPDLTDTTNLA